MKKLKKIIPNLNLLIVLFILVGLVIPLVVAPQPVSAQSWLSDYAYRQKFSLSREDGAVSNYTMVMTVNKGAGTSLNETIYLDSHAENWTATVPNDIRFTQSDGTTELNYGILTSNTTTVKVAVEFNSIGTDPTNFYCYYGNADATDATDLSAVGLYGDDFNRANSDTVGEGWIEVGTADGDIVSNQLQVLIPSGTGVGSHVDHNFTFSQNATVYVRTQGPNFSGDGMMYTLIVADENPTTNGVWGLGFARYAGNWSLQTLDTDVWKNAGSYTPGDWYDFEIRYDNSTRQVTFSINGTVGRADKAGHSDANWATYSDTMAFNSALSPNLNWLNDNVFVRSWVDPEPQWEVWYSEESFGVSVTTNPETFQGTTTVTLNGNLNDMGTYNTTYCYFQYGTTTSYGINTTEQAKYVTGGFEQGLTDLIPATIYHYRAAARYDTDKYVYGNDEIFITDSEEDWYSTYQYRQSFNFTKTTTRTNYPVQLTVHKGTGTSTGSTIYLQNQALSWTSTVPNDIRFTTSEQVALDYWIESSTTTQAVVWVEADSISSTPATFYIYYGKSGDTTTSDGPATFTFFDDFESYSAGSSLSSQSTWSDISPITGETATAALVEVVGDKKTVEVKTNDRRPYHDIAFGSGATEGREVVVYAYCAGGLPDGMGIEMFSGMAGPLYQADINGYNFFHSAWTNTYDAIGYGDGIAASWTQLDQDPDSSGIGTWSRFGSRWYGSTLKLFIDGSEMSTASDSTYSSREHLGFSGGGGADWNIDWVFVRQYDGETVTVDSWVGEGGTEIPTVVTGAVSGFSATSATLWGDITSIGSDSPTVRGFDYGRTYDPFTIVVIPDTQDFGIDNTLGLVMTQWIADNKETHNIVAVLHVGDLCGFAMESEFINSAETMEAIDGMGVPYIVVPGNHDYDGNDPSSYGLTLFDTYFGSSRFGGYDWWSAGDTAGNSYILFEASGIKFIVVGLEFGPTDTDLAWARGVLNNYPDRLAIILTHNYMYFDDTRADYSAGDSWQPQFYGMAAGNDGEDIWLEFVRDYSNIVAVYSGHVCGDGVGQRTDYVEGEPISQALQNYQYPICEPSLCHTYLRFYTFKPNDNQIDAWTYSPNKDEYLTDSQQQFTWPFRSSVGGYESFAYSTTETGTFGTGTYSLVIIGLEAGQTYRYRAKALNTENWGYGSTNSFFFTGEGGGTVPGAPTNFDASATTTQINLSWSIGTGASTTLIRYATDDYPTTIGSGAQLYYGTGTSTSLTTVTEGLIYYFSAWSEAGGVYSTSYATAWASTEEGGGGLIPYPGGFDIDSVLVFRNYLQQGDFLVVLSYKELYLEDPSVDIKECMKIEVFDGDALLAQGVPTQWGFMPASIWIAPGSSLTWGEEYSITLEGREGFFVTRPDRTFVLTSGSWVEDLSRLPTWVLDTAGRMETYYNSLNAGLDLVTYTAEGRVLTAIGGDWFSQAIPNLRTEFPKLFSTGMEGIPGIEEGEVGYEGAENMTVAWGGYIAQQFQDLGESMGLSGESAGGIIWIVFVFLIAGLVGALVGPSMGFILCVPLVGTGVYLRLLDMPMVIAVGIVLFVLAMFMYFIQGKVTG